MYKYIINQIKIGLDVKSEEHGKKVKEKIAGKIGVKSGKIQGCNIVRKSLDCRKNNVTWVYSAEFQVERPLGNPAKLGCKEVVEEQAKEERPSPTKDFQVDKEALFNSVKKRFKEETLQELSSCLIGENRSFDEELSNRPVIVGFGPAGMFAALTLARAGYKPVVFERGKMVDQRTKDVDQFWNGGPLDPDSNVQFGEGGAGTFSDGKLTTGIGDKRIKSVLNDLVTFGGPEEIKILKKAHIGTDVLVEVVKSLREEVKRLGGTICFSHRVEDILSDGNGSSFVVAKDLKENRMKAIATGAVILSMGHSARDTFYNLHERGVEMIQKPFSIGVRIEHPQELIDKSQYGASYEKYKELLPPADYKLSHRCQSGRGVYTFCMCPGGSVIQSASEEGMAVTNGMSLHSRNSGKANSGLLVDVRTEDFGSDHPLAGVEFQRKYEKLAYKLGGYGGVRSSWVDFRDNKGDGRKLAEALPDFAVDSIKEAMPHLGRKLKGFDGVDALMIGVETRSSSPVRFIRHESFESNIPGLYPCGEGAGYAGGIMSAACDGIKVAEEIIATFKPL